MSHPVHRTAGMGMDEGTEVEIRVGPLQLGARVWGPVDGAPVLALHGWLDNAASFDCLAPLLGGLRIIALDLPGHGRSDHRPAGSAYHFIDYPGDVVGAADALGWRRFALLGHSLGGAVATMVAGSFPERIERLALIEALGPLAESPAQAPARLARAITRNAEARDRASRSHSTLERMIGARQTAGGLSHDAARRLVERATINGPEGIRWRSDPRLRLPSPWYLSEEQVLAFLAAIQAPTALIVAEDGLLDPGDGDIRRRLEAVPDLRVHSLPGQHHLHLETPEPVAEVLRSFLAGDRGRTAPGE